MIWGDEILHTLKGDIPVWKAAAMAEQTWGFTWDGHRIQPIRLYIDPDPIEDVSVLRVVLDNNKSVLMTPDTRVVARDGSVVLASALTPGQSVMPLYMQYAKNGYPMYRQVTDWQTRSQAPAPCDRKPWRLVSRMVAEWYRGAPIRPGAYVRHHDGDRTNCTPVNLFIDPGGKAGRRRVKVPIMQNWGTPNNHEVVGVQSFGPVNEVFNIQTTAGSHSVFAVSEVMVES